MQRYALREELLREPRNEAPGALSDDDLEESPPVKSKALGCFGVQGSGLQSLLGGSWDLVSTVISTLSGVISNYKYSYLNYNPSC